MHPGRPNFNPAGGRVGIYPDSDPSLGSHMSVSWKVINLTIKWNMSSWHLEEKPHIWKSFFFTLDFKVGFYHSFTNNLSELRRNWFEFLITTLVHFIFPLFSLFNSEDKRAGNSKFSLKLKQVVLNSQQLKYTTKGEIDILEFVWSRYFTYLMSKVLR